jgi:predicted nucleic acid-binding protein
VIHLDTSFLIRALAAGTPEDRKLRAWLVERTELGISAVCWAEFLCGPVAAREISLVSRIVAEPVPLLAADGPPAAELFNRAGRRRGSFVDCLVAAVALRAEARLATANPNDFRRFEASGLELEIAD